MAYNSEVTISAFEEAQHIFGLEKDSPERIDREAALEADLKNDKLVEQIDLTGMARKEFGQSFLSAIEQGSVSEQSALEAIVDSSVFYKMFNKLTSATIGDFSAGCRGEEFLLRDTPVRTDIGECDDETSEVDTYADDFDPDAMCELDEPDGYGVGTESMTHPVGQWYARKFEVSRQAVCKDLTGLVRRQAPHMRRRMEEFIEYKKVDALVGATDTYNRSGTTFKTYYRADPGGAFPGTDPFEVCGPWVNVVQNDFLTPADVLAANTVVYNQTDIRTGRKCYRDMNDWFTTSRTNRDRMNPLFNSTTIEDTVGSTTFIAPPSVFTGQGGNELKAYERLAERISAIHGVSMAIANTWVWRGNLSSFGFWAQQSPVNVRRISLSEKSQLRGVFSIQMVEMKGFYEVVDPQSGVWYVPTY